MPVMPFQLSPINPREPTLPPEPTLETLQRDSGDMWNMAMTLPFNDTRREKTIPFMHGQEFPLYPHNVAHEKYSFWRTGMTKSRPAIRSRQAISRKRAQSKKFQHPIPGGGQWMAPPDDLSRHFSTLVSRNVPADYVKVKQELNEMLTGKQYDLNKILKYDSLPHFPYDRLRQLYKNWGVNDVQELPRMHEMSEFRSIPGYEQPREYLRGEQALSQMRHDTLGMDMDGTMEYLKTVPDDAYQSLLDYYKTK